MTTIARACLASVLAVTTGCASAAPTLPRPLSPDVRIGAMGERTHFEQAETTDPDTGPEHAPTRAEKRRKSLFWTGVALMGIGTLGFIGFGVGGRVVQKNIADGYDDGTLTRDDEDKLKFRGDLMNGLAVGTVVLGIIGAGMAAIVYGIDRTHCGQLKPRRHTCVPEDDALVGGDDEDAEGEAEASADGEQ